MKEEINLVVVGEFKYGDRKIQILRAEKPNDPPEMERCDRRDGNCTLESVKIHYTRKVPAPPEAVQIWIGETRLTLTLGEALNLSEALAGLSQPKELTK